jgi:Na+-driven multidrug efflux pump/anti-sigma regulatory factor (Ser/Thr protein kinase)
MEKEEEKLGDALVTNDTFVWGLVRRYLLPSICALMVQRLSGLVNSVILGQILGSVGLSVVSLINPIGLIYFSIGSLIGVGGSIVSGDALGKGDKELCSRVFSLSCLIAILLGIIMTIVGLLNLDLITAALGAKDENFELARDYIRFYIAGGMGMLLLYIPLNYLRVTGKPNLAMTLLFLLSLLTVAGIMVFVVALNMGTGGTALASVSAAILASIFGFTQILGKNSPIRFHKPVPSFKQIASIITIGSPSSLNNICRAMQSLSINLLLVRMGVGRLLPAYAVIATGSDFLLAITLGVSQAVLPLVTISFGEKDYRSIRIIMKKTLVTGSIIIGVAAVLVLILHSKIPMVFGVHDATLLANTGIGLICLAFSFNISFINNVVLSYFNGTHRVVIANMIVVSRLVLFMVVPAWLLFPFWGIRAVWFSLIFAEAATLCLTFVVVSILHARSSTLSRLLLLDSSLVEHSKVIDFSVENNTNDVDFASSKINDFCEENELSAKTTMHISLAIEEILIITNEYSMRKDRTEYTDLRIMIIPDETAPRIIMRIRNAGKHFNPVDYYYENKDTEEGRDRTLGIAMIVKIAKHVEYRTTFGVNNLIITI